MSTDERRDERRLAGRYVLGDPIGRGGMGEVWRATDTVLGRQVAVKTIDLRRVPDEAGAARFEREARVTAAMSHPNVVTVHDTGVEGDTAYLVMELLPGPSLADRLAEGPLPVHDVAEVAEQVASALDAAHAQGLVHRDIKPGNLVHAGDGRIRVLDFGITQLGDAGPDQALTATHTVMGTAEYLAPEQATGGRVDGRADLYALGCVLFALLTGSPPFRGATPVATMMMHANDPVPDVRSLRPDTPDWLAALVGVLLAKDPAQRPAGAAAVLDAVRSRRAPAGALAATSVLPAAGAARTQRLSATPAPPAAAAAPPTAPAPPGPARRGASAPLWVLALGLLALGLLAWRLGADGGGGTPDPTPPPSAATSAPAASTSAPEPTTAPPQTTAAPPETASPREEVFAALEAFSRAVRQAERDRLVAPQAGKDLDARVRDIAKALREDDPAKVGDEVAKLREELDKRVDEGQVTAGAADRLDALAGDVEDAAEQYRTTAEEG